MHQALPHSSVRISCNLKTNNGPLILFNLRIHVITAVILYNLFQLSVPVTVITCFPIRKLDKAFYTNL